MVQWVKDLVLSLPWLWLLLWSGFDPWPGGFPCAESSAKKKAHFKKIKIQEALNKRQNKGL